MEATKACNLTEDEVKVLINHHGYTSGPDYDFKLERMNYFHKRFKAFKEEKPVVAAPPATEAKDGW